MIISVVVGIAGIGLRQWRSYLKERGDDKHTMTLIREAIFGRPADPPRHQINGLLVDSANQGKQITTILERLNEARYHQDAASRHMDILSGYMQAVLEHLSPNGGSSLADKIDRIDRATTQPTKAQDSLDRIETRQRKNEGHASPYPGRS